MVVAALLAAGSADAQLVTNTQQIPDTGKPPVVFLNGYQQGCQGTSTFAGTFGIADQVLQRDGRVSLFFNNCDVPDNPPIEELGNAFGTYLGGLRYTDGREVPRVDVVMHSMGGIILRAYLTGKQRERGVFQPPANVKVRKALFVAVPFFGSVAADIAANDIQSQQLQPGSTFLFDFATWNQGRDDLRGIDALAIAASGGTGVLTQKPQFDDSTVVLTSGSMDWYMPGRTRVITGYCHTTLGFPLSIACLNPSQAIARINDDQHPTARIMLSFLNDTTDWQSVGEAPSANQYLKDHAGVQIQLRNAQDQIVRIESASNGLNVRSNEIAWTDFTQAPVSPFRATLSLPQSATANIGIGQLNPGYYQSVVIPVGNGPNIGAVIPNFSDVAPRAMAPGSFISIYGGTLASAAATATSLPYPTALGGTEVLLGGQAIAVQYVSAQQINVVVPDSATGLQRIQVRNSSGTGGINVLIEPAVPSLYATAVNAITGALITASAPARPEDIISLYGTGLGLTERRADGLDWARIQPAVTVGARPCAVSFAGRAPGYVGLDQINCRIATDAAVSDTATAVVQSGNRSSSITVPIR